jgi:pimeloyl-ACP methyl ester carboxylesterase
MLGFVRVPAAVALGFAFTIAACSSPEETARTADELTTADLPVKITAPVAGTFDQVIDHGSDQSGTFKQRYWYTSEFAQGPTSPVLLFICGESECTADQLVFLGDTAKLLHASIVAVEHRYYGQSRPYPDLTLEHMKYLSIHQAIEDLASFETFAKTSLPLAGKWIAVGGSYAGMLAAFYREKHPELVVGAWASSAPVDIQESFWGYDAVASRALGPSCTALFQNALDEIGHDVEQNPGSLAELGKDLFGGPIDPATDKKITENRASGFARQAAQFGKVARLCAALEQFSDEPLQGLIEYVNPPFASDDDPGPAPASPAAPPSGPTPSLLGPGGDADLDLVAPSTDDFSTAQWFYQTCTEVGFFVVANPDHTQSVMPAGFDASSARASCTRSVHTLPDVATTRATYLDPIAQGKVTNLFFVNGSVDPWSSLSFTDRATAPAGVDVYVVQRGTHCSDLSTLRPDSLVGQFEVHRDFVDRARGWLSE